MRKLALLLTAGAFVSFGVLMMTGSDAQARPGYFKAFTGEYKEVKDAKTAKCFVCHVGKSKKNKNNYGKALGKALPKKNTKDAEAIKKALKEAEKAKNKDGKAYGDLLKEGKLPEPIQKNDP